MGSAGNQNPWAPYDSYKDCSLGICSVYCPQWCFYVLPPPPPDDPEDNSGPTFSPLIIAIIGILASAFLLVTYYTLITKYCRKRRDSSSGADVESNRHQTPPQAQAQWQLAASSGLDESVIKSITVCKYRKGEGLVDGTECSVCLSDFQDDENLRLLPKCTHAFHLPCIDTWLKSHSNCPLCRANVNLASPQLPPPPPPPTDLVLVVDDDQILHRPEEGSSVVSLCDASLKLGSCSIGESSERGSTENGDDDDDEEEEEEKGEGVKLKQLRRSISLGGGGGGGEQRIGDHQQLLLLQADGRFKCNNTRPPPHAAFGRSLSTGRLMFSRYDNGKNLF